MLGLSRLSMAKGQLSFETIVFQMALKRGVCSNTMETRRGKKHCSNRSRPWQ
jgi:hypothetical protein